METCNIDPCPDSTGAGKGFVSKSGVRDNVLSGFGQELPVKERL